MKRTTISLPDELAAAVARAADRRRVSVSELTREALSAHLGVGTGKRRKLGFAALGSSGHSTTARDMEEILAAEWGPDLDRDR
jgi:metal-responsive CopG/Arc/MetJ family transcriptional regulator